MSAPSPFKAPSTAPRVLHLITGAKLEASRDGQTVLCSWSVKATLLDGNGSQWTEIPLLANSVALESSAKADAIQASPDPNCYITTLDDRICLIACVPGNYEVCLKFTVPTTVAISRNVLLRQFTVPAPTSPETVIDLKEMTDARVVAQKCSKDPQHVVDVCTKNLPNANSSCKVPSCNQISASWEISPEDIAYESRRSFVSSINANWTVEAKKVKGLIDVEVCTVPKGNGFVSEIADTSIVDLSIWLNSKESNSVVGVNGSHVLGWSHTNSASELPQRMIVQLRVPSTGLLFASSPIKTEKLSILMELPIKLSSSFEPSTIPLITSTNCGDVARGAFQENVNVNIATFDACIKLRKLPNAFAEPELEETDVMPLPVLSYIHPLTLQSSDSPTSITFEAIQHRSQTATAMPFYLETVHTTVTLAPIAQFERRALVSTLMKLRLPTISKGGDRKGESESSWRKMMVVLRPKAFSSSPTAKPIELLSITANGEKINTARVIEDRSEANVTKLFIPLLMLPPALSIPQQTQPPPSPRSVGPLSYPNHYGAGYLDHGEGSSAQGAGRIVDLRFAYVTEVDGDFDGNENQNGSDTTATLPLPSFDVPVGKYNASVYVNDDLLHVIEISAAPLNTQMKVNDINFKETRIVSEDSGSDEIPLSSISCNSSSGNRYEGGLGLSSSYETSKATALMRDQISGLGKRDKGIENQNSVHDKGDGVAKGLAKDVECEDFDQGLERDATGGSLDVNPIESGTLHTFETVILPPKMMVNMRIKIRGEDKLMNVSGAVEDITQSGLSEKDSQTDPCQMGTEVAESEDEASSSCAIPIQKANLFNPQVTTIRPVESISLPKLFFFTAAFAFLIIFGKAGRRVIELGEGPENIFGHAAELIQEIFERKGRYVVRYM